MAAQSSVTLRCNHCGHEWRPRSTDGKARQCSKCRSRDMSEVSPDETSPRGTSSMLMGDDKPLSIKPFTGLASRSQALADDPEIREKLRELELARIEKQIAEARGELVDSTALVRLVSNYKVLLTNINSNGYLTDGDYDTLVSECPWCGEFDIVHEEIRPNVFGWKCQNCGKEVV